MPPRRIDYEKCKYDDCFACIALCPKGILVARERVEIVNLENCGMCKICYNSCPEKAIVWS
ncbi:MAG: 4Fe-4S binding protein [Candidatus Methanofastidiosia archaeon]